MDLKIKPDEEVTISLTLLYGFSHIQNFPYHKKKFVLTEENSVISLLN